MKGHLSQLIGCFLARALSKNFMSIPAEHPVLSKPLYKGCRPKKNSIFKDIFQIGGREVNPISKN